MAGGGPQTNMGSVSGLPTMQAHGKYHRLRRQVRLHSDKHNFYLAIEVVLFVFIPFLFLVEQSKKFLLNDFILYRPKWQRTEPVCCPGWASWREPDALTAVVDDAPAAKPAERGRSGTRSASIGAEQFKLWPWLPASGLNACVESELGK